MFWFFFRSQQLSFSHSFSFGFCSLFSFVCFFCLFVLFFGVDGERGATSKEFIILLFCFVFVFFFLLFFFFFSFCSITSHYLNDERGHGVQSQTMKVIEEDKKECSVWFTSFFFLVMFEGKTPPPLFLLVFPQYFVLTFLSIASCFCMGRIFNRNFRGHRFNLVLFIPFWVKFCCALCGSTLPQKHLYFSTNFLFLPSQSPLQTNNFW